MTVLKIVGFQASVLVLPMGFNHAIMAAFGYFSVFVFFFFFLCCFCFVFSFVASLFLLCPFPFVCTSQILWFARQWCYIPVHLHKSVEMHFIHLRMGITFSARAHTVHSALQQKQGSHKQMYADFQLSHNLKSSSLPQGQRFLPSFFFSRGLSIRILIFISSSHFPWSMFIIAEQDEDILLWFNLWN